MGANAGPDIVSDGLVLALDAADNNSFRGEPTENIAAANLGFSNMTQGGISYSFVEVEDGWRKYSISGTGNSNTYPYTFNILLSTILVSTRTSFSFKYKTNVESKYVSFGDPRMVNIAYAAGRSSTHTQENGYRTAKLENVSPASGTEVQSQRIYFLSRPIEGAVFNPLTDFLYFKDVQAERSPYATRFTTGTRGTTVATGGGWADISGNGNHGEILNGTSTSNDGSMLGALDFDGTNDYIDIDESITLGSEWSVEAWIYLINGNDYTHIFSSQTAQTEFTCKIAETSSDRKPYFYKQGTVNTFSGASRGLDLNTWHHLVYTYDGSTIKIYIDTEEITSVVATMNIGSDTYSIGDSGSTNEFGTFRLSKHTVRTKNLTTSEVLQNYNSLKSRFGL